MMQVHVGISSWSGIFLVTRSSVLCCSEMSASDHKIEEGYQVNGGE